MRKGVIYMKLNHDLIRDIMLYIEKRTVDANVTGVLVQELLLALPKYTQNQIVYHYTQLHTNAFVETANEWMCGKLTDLGEKYLNYIREQSVFEKLKESSTLFPLL